MFAPYCAHCGTRVLLGTRRIVSLTSSDSGPVAVLLRCFCGAEVDADAKAPVARVPAPQSPPHEQVPQEVCV